MVMLHDCGELRGLHRVGQFVGDQFVQRVGHRYMGVRGGFGLEELGDRVGADEVVRLLQVAAADEDAGMITTRPGGARPPQEASAGSSAPRSDRSTGKEEGETVLLLGTQVQAGFARSWLSTGFGQQRSSDPNLCGGRWAADL
jgi:hypothetical protein